MENVSAIILSGGLNTRMGGKNKSFLPIGNQSFLQRIIFTLKPLCNDIVIATKCPEEYKLYIESQLHDRVKIVKDTFQKRTPLSGIHAGLIACLCEYAFVIGCDMPLIKKEVISILINNIEKDCFVVVPKQGIHYQPLCAIYSKKCIPFIENLLRLGRFKVGELFKKVKIKEIDEKEFLKIDPFLQSFININTEEDYKKIIKYDAKQ